jgi:hypothetical protein
LYDCDALGNCGPSLAEIDTTGNPANPCVVLSTDLSSTGYTVDNLNRTLYLRIAFNARDATNVLTGIVIGYQLQVSPAPASPTFNDVPTSDPAFQFIEAFAAAGITAGCSVSPPLYCPDSTVTRRQMAVFLAKALGLNWSQ